ncbi:MAG: LemA family protein [Gammaproteobacteria bacterium]
MKHDETITRMEGEGLLSPAQAESLRTSLGGAVRFGKGKSESNALPWLFFAIGLGLGALFFFFLQGSSPEPEIIQDIGKSLNQPGVTGGMNTILAKLLALFLFLIFPILLFVWLHNGLATQEEEVHKAWAQVESNYQRRSDLIPNLVETVGRYMKYEAETLQEITGQRGESWRRTLDELIDAQKAGGDMLKKSTGRAPEDEAYLAALQQAQQRVGASMRQVLATVENYPQLRASDQMLQLQAQLEGSENRINVARMRFNEAVADFNAAIRRLPSSLVASAGGFQRKAYFKADPGGDKAVDVAFE